MSALKRLREELALSSEQEAVLDHEGSLGLIAGAGAGKTRTLVASVLWDIAARDLSPEKICVCTFTRASAAELRSRLISEAERVTRSTGIEFELDPIWLGTVDSISSKLLRTNAVEAEFSPAMSVGSERELRSISEEALEEALSELSDQEIRALDLIIEWDDPSELLKAFNDWRSAGSGSGPIELSASVSEPPELSALASEISLIATEIYRSSPGEPPAAVQRLDHIVKALEAINRGEELQPLPDLKPGRLRDQLKAEIAEIRPRYESAQRAVIDRLTLPQREAAIRLLEGWRRAYERACREREIDDFISLTSRALQMIRSGRIEPIWERVYVDEAQDTSRAQTEILRGLLRQDGSEVLIGDANQSIYTWRGADLRGFKEALSSLDEASLRDNYRSHPEIVSAVNSFYPAEMRARRAAEESPHHRVELWVPRRDSSRLPPARVEAAAVAPEIARAVRERGLSLSDVCVLVSTNNEVAEYAEALRENELVALAISRKGLLQRPEVGDVIAMISALTREDDEEALIRTLSSPIGALGMAELTEIRGMTGASQPLWVGLERFDDSLLNALQRAKKTLNNPGLRAPEAVRSALRVMGYQAKLDQLDQTGLRSRNVERLLDLIGEIADSGAGRSIAQIAAELRRDLELGADAPQDTSSPEGVDAVLVMTTHQAKGAEFPMVVAARLSKLRRAESSRLVVNRRGEIGSVHKLNKNTNLADSVTASERERLKSERAEEEERTNYVAITRARDWLVIVGSASRPKSAGGRLKFSDSFERMIGSNEDLVSAAEDDSFQGTVGGIFVRSILIEEDSKAPDQPETSELESPGIAPVELGLPKLNKRPISFTSLSHWRECGLRAYLEREMGLEPIRSVSVGGSSGAREAGARAHFEISRWIRSGAAAPDSTLRAALNSESALKRLADEVSAARDHGEISVEESFWAIHPELGEIVGQIDLIARSNDDALITDWKTGERPADDRYSLQREIYAWSELVDGHSSSVECRWVWLESGEVESASYDASDLQALSDSIKTAAQDALNRPPIAGASDAPEPFCSGCPGLSRVCPLSTAALDVPGPLEARVE